MLRVLALHHHARRVVGVRRLLAGVCAAVLLALGAAGPAQAEIVWSKNSEIWAMHDDGSAQRKLIAPVDVGMTHLRAPMPAPTGATFAYTGDTNANRFTIVGLCGTFPYTYSCPTTHYGFNGAGTYRWQAGTSTRLSGAPAYCTDCTSTTSGPTPRADGSIVSTFMMCQGWLGGGAGGGQPYTCTSAIQATSGEVYDSCSDVADAVPSPVDGTRVAHVGCQLGGTNALVTTGPSRAGERVIGCDGDSEQQDPVWSPGGDRVLVVEGGGEPGIWSYSAQNTACFAGDMRHVLVAPATGQIEDPAFLGGDRIIFTYERNLWTIPASCDGCTFAAAATQVTTDGTADSPNADPAWTSDPLVVPAGGGGSGGSGGGGAGGGGGVTPADTVAPTVQLSKTASSQRVGSSSRVAVKVVPSETSTVRVAGKIVAPGKDPVLSAGPTPAPAGSTTTIKIKLGKKAMAALRRAWKAHRTLKAKLTITLTDAAGNAASTPRTITLRR